MMDIKLIAKLLVVKTQAKAKVRKKVPILKSRKPATSILREVPSARYSATVKRVVRWSRFRWAR